MSNLDWSNLDKYTVEELTKEGFGNWDSKLYLVPSKLKDEIPLGTGFIDINYNSVIYGKDTDLDTRFGCYAFGVIPCNIEEYNKAKQRRKYAEDDGVIYEDDSNNEESSLKELKEYISNCVTSRINPEIMDQINGDLGEYHIATDVSESVMRYIFKNRDSIIKGLQNYEN